MASKHKIFDFEDVATQHHTIDDCWLIVHGKVYDVTTFLPEHPGGDDVLLAATGKDATGDFEDVGHSETARNLMEKYCIGKVDESTVSKKRHFFIPSPKSLTPENVSDFLIKASQVLVPLVILGLTYAIKQFTKAETVY